MDVQDYRKFNLDKAIGNQGKHGRIADFAKQHDLEASWLSQLLNNHRGFGEKAARNIEHKAKLQPGSLDAPPNINQISEESTKYLLRGLQPDEIALLQAYRESSPELKAAALRMLVAAQESDNVAP